MTDAIQDRILQAVFRLSRDTCPIDATILGREAGVSAVDAAEALVALERAGLVDASRARLTMLGLARACALGAEGGGPVLANAPPAPAVGAPARTPSGPPLAASAVVDSGPASGGRAAVDSGSAIGEPNAALGVELVQPRSVRDWGLETAWPLS